MRRVVLFPWYGNKNGLLKWILSLMPPHITYAEAFAGAAAVLLAKKPSTVEIWNDLDRRLYGYFRVLTDPAKARLLRHHLELTPYSRQVYDEVVAGYYSITDEVQRAVAFHIIATQSFCGKFGAGWKCSTQRNCAKPYFKSLKLIEAVVRRLRNVQIENRDYKDILSRYDSPTSLFFLDPPYPPDVRVTPKAYPHEMPLEDHRELLGLVRQVKGMVMLCGYPHPLYDEALVGWERHEEVVYCKSTANKHQGDGSKSKYRTEVIWLNPRAAEARPR
jgi:DNA adenine methylase